MRTLYLGMIFVLLGSAYLLAQSPDRGKRVHGETSFGVVVHAPLADAVKLFTPEGERVWAGEHWDPQYVYPAGPTRDAPGAVFTIRHGPLKAVWTVVQRDDVTRNYEYAYFIPDVMVTTINVQFQPVNAETTNVHVTYARTALSQAGEAHVAAMTEGDRKAGAEWQSALNRYFAAKTGLDR